MDWINSLKDWVFQNWPALLSYAWDAFLLIAFLYKTMNRKNKFEGLILKRLLKVSKDMRQSIAERKDELEEDEAFAKSFKDCKRVSDFVKVGEERTKTLESRAAKLLEDGKKADDEVVEFSTVEVKRK